MTNPIPSTGDNESPLFDQQIAKKLVTAIDGILAEHPEAAAVSAIVTWRGGLNDAKIVHGTWRGRGPEGAVQDPAVIFASIGQALLLLGMMTGRAVDWLQTAQERAVVLATEEIRLREEIERLQAVAPKDAPGT